MNFLNELRYTFRVMAKNIRFTLLCVTVIAVGIGMVLPLYALVDNLAFRTPQYADGERYVGLNKIFTAGRRPPGLATFDLFHYRYFQQNARSFEELFAWQNLNLTASEGEYVEVFRGAVLEPRLLQLPSVQPAMGRLFSAEDAEAGAPPVAIISVELWQNFFARRADIVGHQARINGEVRTIIGVMPLGFGFPLNQQLWLPLALPATASAGESEQNLVIVGKLAAGTSVKQASAEIALQEARLLEANAERYPALVSAEVVPYIQMLNAISGTWFAVGMLVSIMLLVSFNIGNLFIARGEERTSELSIRSALGAAPLRLAQSILLESLLVCCCGLLLGLVIAWFGIAYVGGFLNSASAGQMGSMFWWDMSLNARMIFTSLLAVAAIWLGSGGLPAWKLSRSDLHAALAGSGKGATDRGNSRTIRVLVNLQLILGCVLLTYGVMQVVSFTTSKANVMAEGDLSYAAQISFATTSLTAEDRLTYMDDLARNLGGGTGIETVGFGSAVPFFSPSRRAGFNIEEQDLRVSDSYPEVLRFAISGNYLQVLNKEIVEGRSFNAGDTADSLAVAIIDERLAAQYWPGQSALGKRIQLDPGNTAKWLTIVGVSNALYMERRLYSGQRGTPLVYQPLAQVNPAQFNLVVKFAAPPANAQDVIRKAAVSTNRDVPVTGLASFNEIGARADEGDSFNLNLFIGFIVIALYLTGAATYGLAARAASRRRVETGIRMALGANQFDSLMVFIRDGFRMVVIGLGIGGVVAVLISYIGLSSNTVAVNVAALLIPTVTAIALIMGTLVMLANYFPARKIIAMEPADALRHE